MKQAFQYNLIRFQPDLETEEFAVIGVVVYSPTNRQLAYRLLDADHYQRIHDFFSPLDERVLPAALQMIETELQRVQKLLPSVDRPDALYAELIREREDILRFAPTSLISGEQISICTNDLFKRYVQRDFPLPA
ncbi:MAG: DUF3037 domain-containing protein [Thiolinea sp.]